MISGKSHSVIFSYSSTLLISRLGSEKYKVYEPEIRRVELYENITECDFPEITEN